MRTPVSAAKAAVLSFLVLIPVSGAVAQEATPTVTYGCDVIAAGSPTADMPMAEMSDMAAGSPMADMDHMAMELDQMYIDMMIPHHESIIAMAQASLSRLTDERLQEIAQAVIATQQPEIDELRGYREEFYGDSNPMPMDMAMMTAMSQMMPNMSGTMEEMAFQMDAAAQVAAICEADDGDLVFIDLTIPHHQMAVEASEETLEQATHQEIRDFAQKVIDAQQREIEELEMIRQDLTGEGTPANS